MFILILQEAEAFGDKTVHRILIYLPQHIHQVKSLLFHPADIEK